MKKILFLLLLIPGLVHASGFIVTLNGASEVPPNNSAFTGAGLLMLTGSNLDCAVEFGIHITPTSGGIYGPASSGEVGPLIFDLGEARGGFDPGDGLPGGEGYLADFSLTPRQITDLDNGLWYVNITSAANPDGEIRGQIVPAPEPSALSFFGASVALLGLWRWRKRLHQPHVPIDSPA